MTTKPKTPQEAAPQGEAPKPEKCCICGKRKPIRWNKGACGKAACVLARMKQVG